MLVLTNRCWAGVSAGCGCGGSGTGTCFAHTEGLLGQIKYCEAGNCAGKGKLEFFNFLIAAVYF